MNEDSRSRDEPLSARVRATMRMLRWRRLGNDPGAVADFAAQDLARRRRGVIAFCLVSGALMAASGLISVTAQEHLGSLLSIRLIALAALSLIGWIMLTPFGASRPGEVGLCAVMVVAGSMEALAVYTGGQASVQHDRLSLVILGAAFLLASSPAWAAAVAILVSGICVANLAATEGLRATAVLRHLAYLGASGVVATVIAAVREGRRWRDFCRDRSLAEARRAVAEREHRYGSLFETAGSAIVVLAPDRRILEFNREAERISGWRREEVLGRDYVELFVADPYRAVVIDAIDKTLAGAPFRDIEGRLRRRDGSYVVLLWNVAPLSDAEGRCAGIVGVGFDITRRRRAEQRVRASEERFRTIVENAPLMIDAFDAEGRCILWNRECEKALGWTRDEMAAAADPLALCYPDPEIRQRALATIQCADGQFREYSVRAKDGSMRDQIWADFRLPDGSAISMAHDITDLKRIETALRQGEEHVRRLLETTNAISWEADAATWEPRYVSPQAIKVLGYPIEHWRADFWVAHIHPDDREPVVELCRAAIARGDDFEFEYRMIAADGRVVWLQDLVSVEFEGGVPRTLRGVMIDITERKLAEERRRESDARLRILIETTNAIPWEADAKTWRFTYVGPQAVRVLGYPTAHWQVDDFWAEHIHPDDRSRTIEYYRKASRHCAYYDFEYRMVAADGSVVWLHDLVTVDFRDGEPQTLRGFMIDITERKQAEDALRRAREEYEGLYEGAPDMFLSVERPSGRIVKCNATMLRATGYSTDEVLGRHILDMYHPDCREDALQAFHDIGTLGGVTNRELQVRRKDGGKLDVRLSVSTVRDEQGRVVLAQGSWRDITELKLAERNLSRSEARYRHLVDSSQGFVWTHDLDGTILSVNPAAAAALGYETDEIVGRHTRMLLPESGQDPFDTYLERIRQRSMDRGVVRAVTKAGEERIWLYRNAVYSEPGRQPYVIGHAQDVTELERAKEALRYSEERYRAVVEDQAELICRYRPSGRLTFANDAFCRYFRKSREEVVGQAWRPPIVDEDFPRLYQAFVEIGPDRPTCTLEHRVATADGEVHWQQWTNRAILDAAGRVVEYQCVGRDITERKRAEEEIEGLNRVLEERVRERTEQLRASEAQSQSLFHATPIGIAITTAGGGFVDTNPAFQHLVGRSGVELQALTFADVTHPDDLQESWRASRELLDGKRDLVPLVKRYVRPDGHVVWADVSVTAIRSASGAYRYGFAMIQDATERKNEEAIRTGEQRALALLAQDASLEEALTALIEALHEPDPEMLCAVLLADGDGKRLWYGAAPHLPDGFKRKVDGVEIGPSNGSCGTAAHRRERVIVEDVATDPLWAAYRDVALEHGLRGCWSEPIISAAGALLGTFALFYRQPRGPTGVEIRLIEGAAAVAGIIIERKRSADLLKRHQIELAHVGRVSLVGQLASGLAHELHQPLAAIAAYAGACVRRVHSGDIERPDQLIYPVEQMQVLALRAGDIVRGLRTLIQNGDPHQERADLNELVRVAVRLAQPEARQHGITLRLELASSLPPVDVVAIQIEQVVLNLVSNGIEAMTDGGGTGGDLVVRSYGNGDGGVVVAVCDAGHGLPEERERVFEPFYTTKTSGLGMGLAICRSIVESQGGRLWAEPNPEGGTTFSFRLPAASSVPIRRGAAKRARRPAPSVH